MSELLNQMRADYKIPEDWVFYNYGDIGSGCNWYGLKSSKETKLGRGIPEGIKSLWLVLVLALENGDDFHSKRLGLSKNYIISPKNTKDPKREGFWVGDPNVVAAWIRGNLNE